MGSSPSFALSKKHKDALKREIAKLKAPLVINHRRIASEPLVPEEFDLFLQFDISKISPSDVSLRFFDGEKEVIFKSESLEPYKNRHGDYLILRAETINREFENSDPANDRKIKVFIIDSKGHSSEGMSLEDLLRTSKRKRVKLNGEKVEVFYVN